MNKQSDNSLCEADGRCVFSDTVCVAAAAEDCEAASGNETACGMLADCAFVGGGCSAVANCTLADLCAGDGCRQILGVCEQARPCTSEWEGDLGLPASVSNSDDDAERKATCEANPDCEYRNTLVYLHIIETICIAIFTFEYIFKLATCTQRCAPPPRFPDSVLLALLISGPCLVRVQAGQPERDRDVGGCAARHLPVRTPDHEPHRPPRNPAVRATPRFCADFWPQTSCADGGVMWGWVGGS